EAGINRVAINPKDGSIYVGGVGSTGNWGHAGKLWYGLQRLQYNEKPTFEMLAVRAKSNGVEIEFTEPLKVQDGTNPADYLVRTWWYKPTEEYGGPKMEERPLKVKSASVSIDRKKVFLEVEGMKDNHLVYIRLKNPFISQNGNGLWTTECWYTMNNIPQDNAGKVSTLGYVPQTDNALIAAERDAGWELLFDGKTLTGWRNFKKEGIGQSWVVDDGAIHLRTFTDKEGNRKAMDGGDIITNRKFENFELNLDWKIQDCGNSGIMFNVVENDDYDYVWQTGPEMQVLDNRCHPDAKFVTHQAGDLYDMIACKYLTVKPAGEWNKVRLIVNNGHVEHWLNGYKVVEYQMFDDNWTEMIANSKFKDMTGFGKAKSGHLSLQDHSDGVWFKNIKIREIKPNTQP
ncbi:MAG: 3-keto-disaccharide hydrolase, partial [Chitinophagales bacterium]